jgi:hypothetical protein
MKLDNFYELHNFHVDELDIYGRSIITDIDIIEEQLMLKTDQMVSMAKETFGSDVGQFIVHSIVAGKHAKKSKHYIGQAIDGHFAKLNLYQSVMVGLKAGFGGIGYYPWWNNPGVHLDIRAQIHPSTWASFEKGKYNYDFQTFIERLLMYADT